MVITPHEVVSRRLARRIGAVGLVLIGLGEGRIAWRQRAVDLVGGDVQKAEGRLGVGRQRRPVAAGGLQEPERADDVGLNEVFRAVDGAVDMAFCGEMHDRPDRMLAEQRGDQIAVADVATHEDLAAVARDRLQILEVARVGEHVEIDDRLVAGGEPVEDEITADKAGAARNEDHPKGTPTRLLFNGKTPSSMPLGAKAGINGRWPRFFALRMKCHRPQHSYEGTRSTLRREQCLSRKVVQECRLGRLCLEFQGAVLVSPHYRAGASLRKTKPPFLLPITMSTRPSAFRSPTANCVPTPEASSILCGTYFTASAPVLPPSRTSSNQ